MQIHNVEQASPAWFELRKGKMTASHAQAIGSNGKWLKTYIWELMSEYFSTQQKEHFSNVHTERGVELEPQAREIYELMNDCTVEQVGFIEYDEFCWCSPDGLVSEDGGTEIKCQDDKKHFNLCLYGESEIDSGYIWQIQMNLWITGRKWWDFISYNPNYKKSIFVHRVYRDEEKIKKLQEWYTEGINMIREIKAKYTSLI
jgi:putative phage-type endonuclease